MGYCGNVGYLDVQVVIDNVVCMIVVLGKVVGMLMFDVVFVCYYLELGCIFVVIGVDILMFVNGVCKFVCEFIVL